MPLSVITQCYYGCQHLFTLQLYKAADIPTINPNSGGLLGVACVGGLIVPVPS